MSTKQEKPKLMVQNVSCIIPQTDTLGGLYVGNTYGAQNVQILKQYGIRAVLTTSIQTPQTYDPISIPFHLKISAHDKSDYQIIEHLQECLDFIHKYRQVTNVFVHCYAGVSRSVTIIVAYLMKYWGWGLKVALAFVQAKRVVAKPNDGFMQQLKRYQDSLLKNNPHNQHNRPSSAIVTPQYKSQQQIKQNNLGYTQPYIQIPKQHESNRQSYQQTSSVLNQIRQQFQLTTPLNLTKKHSQTPIPKILTNNTNKNQYDRKQMIYSPTSPYQQQKYHSNSTSHVKMVSAGSHAQYGTYSSHYYNPNTNSINLNSQVKSKNSIFGNHNTNNTNTNTNTNMNMNNTSSVSQNKSSKVLIRPKDLPGYKN